MTAPHSLGRDDRRPPLAARGRYLAPTIALTIAGVLLAISLFLPYWELILVTPAHADELRLVSYLGHVEGPVETVLAAGGVRSALPMHSLSQLERSLAMATVTVICLLVVAATLVHNRWAALLALPAFCFPAIVMADTSRWLKPVIEGLATAAGAPAPPPALLQFGRVVAGRIVLEIHAGAGLLLASAASMTVVAGLWLHRSAYKPSAGDG